MEKTINQRLYEFMKLNSISIRTLSGLLNINEKTLGHKLGGRSKLDLETILSLLTCYNNLSADWLLLGSGPMLRTHEYSIEPANWQFNDDGDNISGYGNTIHKDNARVVELLEKQLEEEKARSREYWNTIQQLIKK